MTALSFLILSLTPGPQTALAEDQNDVPGWSTIEAARKYAARDGVAVLIFQGNDVDLTARQIGDAFVAAFKKFDTDAAYFTDDLGYEVTSISFFLDAADAIGPFNFADAARKIPEMAEKHRIANLPNVHR